MPGGDGVGVLPDGQRVYFAFPTPPFGSMAERTVVPASLCVSLPDELDDVTAVAAANPGTSSSAPLMERAKLGADGGGLGSVSNERSVNSVGEASRAMIPKGFKVSAQPVPLAQVARTWASKRPTGSYLRCKSSSSSSSFVRCFAFCIPNVPSSRSALSDIGDQDREGGFEEGSGLWIR